MPVDSKDPLVATTRTALPGTLPVTGPVSDSDATGPGTLLWAEAANSGWKATLDGDTASRHDAFGWTRFVRPHRYGFRRPVVLRWRAPPARVRRAGAVDRRGRRVVAEPGAARAGGFPMTRTSVPRLPLVLVLVIAAIVAIVIGNADPEPAPAAAKVDQAATLPTAGTRSGAWFCPGFPAAVPLEEQTLTVSNVGTDSGDAIVTVFPDDGSPAVAQTIATPARFGQPAATRAARARRRSVRGGLLTRRRGRVRGRESLRPHARSVRIGSQRRLVLRRRNDRELRSQHDRPAGRGVAHTVQPVRNRRARRRDAAHQRGSASTTRADRRTPPDPRARPHPRADRAHRASRGRGACDRRAASWPSSR